MLFKLATINSRRPLEFTGCRTSQTPITRYTISYLPISTSIFLYSIITFIFLSIIYILFSSSFQWSNKFTRNQNETVVAKASTTNNDPTLPIEGNITKFVEYVKYIKCRNIIIINNKKQKLLAPPTIIVRSVLNTNAREW